MVNIVIAEDDLDDFELLQEAIQTSLPKFNIKHFQDGKAFMRSVTQDVEADLIFLDLNIPKKNGLECLSELRQLEKLKPVPTIIYSTSADVEDIDHCYKLGCTLYLVKPASFKDLVTQIRKIFFRLGLPRQDLKYKEMFVVRKRHDRNEE